MRDYTTEGTKGQRGGGRRVGGEGKRGEGGRNRVVRDCEKAAHHRRFFTVALWDKAMSRDT